MPNWSKNKLSVTGPKDEVDAFVKKAEGPIQDYKTSEMEKKFFGYKDETPRISVLSFHQLVPIPDEVMARGYDEPKYRPTKETGFDWEVKLWGVKWGASEVELERVSDGHALYSFNTAWAPPCKLLETVSKQFPKLFFYLSFSEEMPTRGRFIYRNGKKIEEIIGSNDFDDEYPEEGTDEQKDVWNSAYTEWADYYIDTHLEWVEKELK